MTQLPYLRGAGIKNAGKNFWSRIGLGTVCGLSLVVAYAVHIHQPWPMGPDTESEFFKSYNPEPPIERFACGNIVAGSSGGQGSSFGVGFVSHQRGITANSEIDEDHWVPLMQALAADVNKQLLLAGSEGSGEKGKGLASRFYYQDGRSLGSVTIPPLITRRLVSGGKLS